MKHRLFITFIAMAVSILKGTAQESIISEINYQQLEKLVQLAKEHNFRSQIFKATESMAKSGVTAAQLSYLEAFSGAYYYRPNNRPTLDWYNPYLVNGFQLGVNINLGSFLQKPMAVKQAKQEKLITQLERQEHEETLETEVKARYYAYILYNNQLKASTQAVQDDQMIFNQIQQQFKQGEIELDSYNLAKTSLIQSQTTLHQTEVEFLKAKDALEMIIGVKLEEINNL